MFILVAVTKVCLRKQVAASISLQVARRLHIGVTEGSFFPCLGNSELKAFGAKTAKRMVV